jgi:hypothetical protein
MVKVIGYTISGNKKELQGLSTDIKPITDIGSGSTFYELDTGKGWIFDTTNINSSTGNGWWPL